MKKVLFVATITGHITGFHIPYLKWFKDQGYEVHTASNGDREIKYCDKHFDLPFDRLPWKFSNLKVYKELKKIVNENNYEIIHCHTPVGGLLTRLAAKEQRKKGTKVIYTAHGFHFYKGASILNWVIYYPIEKLMANYTDCIITINKEDYEIAKKKMNAEKIELVHGVGLNTQRFDKIITEKEKNKIREKLNIKEDDIILTYVAELNKNKNQILLINAIERLITKYPNIKLILVGPYTKNGYYEEEIKKKNLENNIILTGKNIEDVPVILSLTDLYVASSIREGLPVNIMEAMYMKLPIIATNNRGHRELVENDANGYIVDNNVNSFVERIQQTLNDKEKMRKLGEKSYEKSLKYTDKIVIKEMEKIYREMEG